MSHQLIVAIGRESGSGGLDIAHALAERLQLPLFDKSILQKAAEDKGVSAQTLERYDERPYSPLFCRSVRGISSAPEDCVAQMQFELLRQHTNCPQLNQRARGHRRAGIKHHVQRVAIPGQRLGQRAVVRRVGHRHRLKAVGDDKPRFSIGFVLNDPARRDLSDGVKFFRVVFRLGEFQYVLRLRGGGQKQTGSEDGFYQMHCCITLLL